jgi:methylmalonyl-CoA/ethylmalonyl-CoA epimerase
MAHLNDDQMTVLKGILQGKTVGQVAYLVEDLVASVKHWNETFGTTDWRIYTYSPETVPQLGYRGARGAFSMRLALSGSDPQIELIQPMAGPSIYHDWVEQHGFGQHHVGIYVDSVADQTAKLESVGIPAIQTGSGYGQNGDGGFAYFDLVDTPLNLILELIEVPAVRRESESL